MPASANEVRIYWSNFTHLLSSVQITFEEGKDGEGRPEEWSVFLRSLINVEKNCFIHYEGPHVLIPRIPFPSFPSRPFFLSKWRKHHPSFPSISDINIYSIKISFYYTRSFLLLFRRGGSIAKAAQELNLALSAGCEWW